MTPGLPNERVRLLGGNKPQGYCWWHRQHLHRCRVRSPMPLEMDTVFVVTRSFTTRSRSTEHCFLYISIFLEIYIVYLLGELLVESRPSRPIENKLLLDKCTRRPRHVPGDFVCRRTMPCAPFCFVCFLAALLPSWIRPKSHTPLVNLWLKLIMLSCFYSTLRY